MLEEPVSCFQVFFAGHEKAFAYSFHIQHGLVRATLGSDVVFRCLVYVPVKAYAAFSLPLRHRVDVLGAGQTPDAYQT